MLLNTVANVAHKLELNFGLLDVTTFPGKVLFELGNLLKTWTTRHVKSTKKQTTDGGTSANHL